MSELEHPWSIEESCFAAGSRSVCGADEAGAGPLAGPVYAAAVILPRGFLIPGLNDSKKLTPRSGTHFTMRSLQTRPRGRWHPPLWRKSRN
jgi:hypothetical protein